MLLKVHPKFLFFVRKVSMHRRIICFNGSVEKHEWFRSEAKQDSSSEQQLWSGQATSWLPFNEPKERPLRRTLALRLVFLLLSSV